LTPRPARNEAHEVSSEGRSTSTIITAFPILNQLCDAGFKQEDQKLLSFTDNRQAGAATVISMTVQVVRLRAGIVIPEKYQRVTYVHDNRRGVFKALGLPFLWFANTNEEPPLAMVRRNYEQWPDYSVPRCCRLRSWRSCPTWNNAPHTEYADIDEIAATDGLETCSSLGELNRSDRKEFICTILDFFRLEYAFTAKTISHNRA
jgi:hypothetical protein